MDKLVSIIIPVYNTSRYLDMCLESVVHQTYHNLQIILVDDGSTDNSPKMCDDWCRRDKRIEVIHKQNEGLGYTRNAGLKVVRGEFVSFLDSDDTIDSETIEECVDALEENKADACFYGRKTQKADGTVYLNPNIPSKLIYTEEEIKREFAARYFGDLPDSKGLNYIQASVCCGMYRYRIINEFNIEFRSERECMSEDTFFNLDVCQYAARVIILPRDFYSYTYNPRSLTKSYNPSKFVQFKNFYETLTVYYKNYQQTQDIDIRMKHIFYVYLRHVIEYEVHAVRIIGVKNVYMNLKKICGDSFVQRYLNIIGLENLDSKRKVFVRAISRKQILFLMLYYLLIKK